MNLDLRILKALAIIAGKDETRYYLKGVHLRAQGSALIAEATDGHIAAMIRTDAEIPAGFESSIIPLELLDKIKLNKRENDCVLAIVGQDVAITYDRATYSEKLLDGTFPRLAGVLPSELSGVTAQFNPDLISRFLKARRIFNPKASLVSIAHNGDGPAIVNFLPELDSVGVAMPMRSENSAHVLSGAPDWAFGEAEKAEAIAAE